MHVNAKSTINRNDGSVACPFAEMPRRRFRRNAVLARLRWKVFAFSPRDGGWVRWFAPCGFKTYAEANLAIEAFRPLWERTGDYQGFMVKRVIVFDARTAVDLYAFP